MTTTWNGRVMVISMSEVYKVPTYQKSAKHSSKPMRILWPKQCQSRSSRRMVAWPASRRSNPWIDQWPDRNQVQADRHHDGPAMAAVQQAANWALDLHPASPRLTEMSVMQAVEASRCATQRRCERLEQRTSTDSDQCLGHRSLVHQPAMTEQARPLPMARA
jgi:hypothetical protein